MSRWLEETGGSRGPSYDAAFRELAASGMDVHGEAAYVAALVPPGIRVLDAGCGTGRVAAGLEPVARHATWQGDPLTPDAGWGVAVDRHPR